MTPLYEDNHIIIVSKRSGEIVQGDKTGDVPLSDTVGAYLKEKYNKPGNVFVGVPHRLDRPVSGLVVLAKTSKALSRLNDMFRVGSVDKRYLAIVKNRPAAPEGELVNWLVRNEKQNRSYAYDREVPDSKKAILRYRLVASSVNYNLLEVELLTGRHHQIRCQLAKMGCPIKGDLDEVAKLLHLYRDFYTFLCNFVSFRDFYDPDGKAIFQAGELYIDERCCELCIKVPDMGPHATATSLSGMYILYCNCLNKITGETMIIAAVMTDGDVADLREGKHGLFYDRKGAEWDATVFKIIENPISIRQAFWAPYRKIGRYIETTIEKRAAEKDSKVMADMTAKVDNAGKDGAAGAEKKKPFDIAAFAGIFAAIGLAVSGLMSALAKMSDSVSDWSWWKWLILVIAVMLVISGPSMILAWLKIRKRNLSPLLNANGWAINASVKVNMTFGATLTEMGRTPLKAEPDPFADKAPWWKKLLYWLIGLGLVFWICYSQNWIEKWTDNSKWHYEKKDKKTPAPAENAESLLILTEDAFRA